MLRLVLAGVLMTLVIVPVAEAASTTQILRDCADDSILQGDYTPAELRKARQRIPTDTDEYTDCRDVLARAASRGTSRSHSGTGGGGGDEGGGSSGALLTPSGEADERALHEASKGGVGTVDVGGDSIVPGAVGFDAAAARNDLPPTLLVPLILLGAAVLAGAIPRVRRSGMAAVSGAGALFRRYGRRG